MVSHQRPPCHHPYRAVDQVVLQVKRHVKPTGGRKGGIISKEQPIHVSNVALTDSEGCAPSAGSVVNLPRWYIRTKPRCLLFFCRPSLCAADVRRPICGRPEKQCHCAQQAHPSVLSIQGRRDEGPAPFPNPPFCRPRRPASQRAME